MGAPLVSLPYKLTPNWPFITWQEGTDQSVLFVGTGRFKQTEGRSLGRASSGSSPDRSPNREVEAKAGSLPPGPGL